MCKCSYTAPDTQFSLLRASYKPTNGCTMRCKCKLQIIFQASHIPHLAHVSSLMAAIGFIPTQTATKVLDVGQCNRNYTTPVLNPSCRPRTGDLLEGPCCGASFLERDSHSQNVSKDEMVNGLNIRLLGGPRQAIGVIPSLSFLQ